MRVSISACSIPAPWGMRQLSKVFQNASQGIQHSIQHRGLLASSPDTRLPEELRLKSAYIPKVSL